MNCDEAREKMTESLVAPRLSGTAGPGAPPAAGARPAELAAHLAACDACRAEAEALRRVWGVLERLPEEVPGEEMRQRFAANLEPWLAARRRAGAGRLGGARRALERLAGGLEGWLDRVLPRRPLVQAGLAAATLALGLALGSGLVGSPALRGGRGAAGTAAGNSATTAAPGAAARDQIGELREEVRSLSQLVTLSLLKQDSASERLRGVSFGRHAEMADLAEVGEPGDDRVLQALLDTLSHDPDVNVRLAAVDALAPALGRPPVRDRMLTEVVTQRSPMVQIALIDLLMGRDRAGSQRRLQELAASPSLDETVRGYLRSRLRQVS
jgi:hypothetical protein